MPRGTRATAITGKPVDAGKTQDSNTLEAEKIEILDDAPINEKKIVRHKISPLPPSTVDPQALISLGLEKNVPIDTMERLFNMRRELKAEASRDAFFQDFALFQSECPVIVKNKTAKGEKFSYKYATLDEIVRQVQPYLTKYGFSYTFKIEGIGEQMIVACEVHHKEGHTETTRLPLTVDQTARMNAIQKTGSALSYAKRYAFCDALGIATADEDNDGQSSEDNDTPQEQQPLTRTQTASQPAKSQQQSAVTDNPDYMTELELFFQAENTNASQRETILKAVNKKKPEDRADLIKAIIAKKEAIKSFDGLVLALKHEFQDEWIDVKEKCKTTEDYLAATERLRDAIYQNHRMRKEVKLDAPAEQPKNTADETEQAVDMDLF